MWQTVRRYNDGTIYLWNWATSGVAPKCDGMQVSLEFLVKTLERDIVIHILRFGILHTQKLSEYVEV